MILEVPFSLRADDSKVKISCWPEGGIKLLFVWWLGSTEGKNQREAEIDPAMSNSQ